MKRMLFALILFPLALLAQSLGNYLSNDEVPRSFKERYFSKGEHDFFPLHVGDLWQYMYYDHDEQDYVYPTEKIVKDTMALGHRYFVRYRYWPHNNTTYVKLLGYYRVDSAGVLRVLDVDDRNGNGITDEELMGDSLDVPPETSYLSFAYVYPDSHFVRDTMWYLIDNDTLFTRMVFTLGGEHFYTDKIGLTLIWPEQSEPIYLTGAIINGETHGTIVGVEDETDASKPQNFELSQNYPNPFNPTTNITYVIASPDLSGRGNLSNGQRQIASSQAPRNDGAVHVSLKIYDALGREVTTLVNAKQAPGKYSVQFNATNLPSGVYFYTLRAGNFIQTKKMVLMK